MPLSVTCTAEYVPAVTPEVANLAAVTAPSAMFVEPTTFSPRVVAIAASLDKSVLTEPFTAPVKEIVLAAVNFAAWSAPAAVVAFFAVIPSASKMLSMALPLILTVAELGVPVEIVARLPYFSL